MVRATLSAVRPSPSGAGAIVVLGCRVTLSGRLTPPAARRAAAAASAFHAGVAPYVITSGGRRWGSHPEARAFRAAITRAGVPKDAIIEELCSLSTYENAIFSAAILRRLDAHRAAVVTCPWHMARALDSFRAAGVDAVPLPAARGAIALGRRVYLEAHEIVCRWFDARAMARAEVLTASAALLARPTLAAIEPIDARAPEIEA